MNHHVFQPISKSEEDYIKNDVRIMKALKEEEANESM